jgi:hypothetical protein
MSTHLAPLATAGLFLLGMLQLKYRMAFSLEYPCCVCAARLRFEPHVHPGRTVPQWGGLIICRACEGASHDGIAIASHPDLPPRIKEAGGKVTLNAAGHIVIPPIGSK